MKKSFWGVMLTLAALVMMLGASSAFANSSADVKISFDMGSWGYVSSDNPVVFASADSIDYKNPELKVDKAIGTHNSKDIDIVVTSKDTSGNWHLIFDLKAVSMDGTTNDVGKVGISADIVSAGIFQAKTTTEKYANAKLVTALKAFDSTPANRHYSFDIVVSAETASFDVVFLVCMSGDTASADFGYVAKVNVLASLDESGETDGVFKKATLKITNSAGKTTGIVPPEVTVSSDKTEAEVTISADLAGQTLSIDISGAKLDSADTNVTFVTSDDSSAKVTIKAPTATEATKAYKFRFTSGDDGAIVTLTVKVEGSSTTTADYGSFTLTPANATSTTAVSVVSTDYKGKLCASADATATALTKSGSFTAEDVTTFTLTFKATAGDDGSISIADVYDVSDTSDIVSVSDDLSNNVFTPKLASSYRILFKATPKTTSGTVTTGADSDQYFTVNFSLAESGSSTEDATTKKEYNNAAKGTVNVSDLSTTEILNLNSAYDVDITNLPKDSSGRARAFLMKLPAAPAVGDVIRIKFVPSSNGTPNFTSTGIETGYFKAKLAHPVIVVTCYGLVDSSTTSTLGSDPLYFDPGTYVVLARNFTANSTSVGSFNTAADETDAKLEEDTYAGNEEPLGSNKGSSSGCDAGFGALALLALALPLVKKFSK